MTGFPGCACPGLCLHTSPGREPGDEPGDNGLLGDPGVRPRETRQTRTTPPSLAGPTGERRRSPPARAGGFYIAKPTGERRLRPPARAGGLLFREANGAKTPRLAAGAFISPQVSSQKARLRAGVAPPGWVPLASPPPLASGAACVPVLPFCRPYSPWAAAGWVATTPHKVFSSTSRATTSGP